MINIVKKIHKNKIPEEECRCEDGSRTVTKTTKSVDHEKEKDEMHKRFCIAGKTLQNKAFKLIHPQIQVFIKDQSLDLWFKQPYQAIIIIKDSYFFRAKSFFSSIQVEKKEVLYEQEILNDQNL